MEMDNGKQSVVGVTFWPRIFGLDEVSDNFLNKVASTYEAMFASNDLINLEMRISNLFHMDY